MDSTTRMYAAYNGLQTWLGSDQRLSEPKQYVSDHDLNTLAQGCGYTDWSDYKVAEAYAAEDLEAQKGQY